MSRPAPGAPYKTAAPAPRASPSSSIHAERAVEAGSRCVPLPPSVRPEDLRARRGELATGRTAACRSSG